jgi:hypothetical protein
VDYISSQDLIKYVIFKGRVHVPTQKELEDEKEMNRNK